MRCTPSQEYKNGRVPVQSSDEAIHRQALLRQAVDHPWLQDAVFHQFDDLPRAMQHRRAAKWLQALAITALKPEGKT